MSCISHWLNERQHPPLPAGKSFAECCTADPRASEHALLLQLLPLAAAPPPLAALNWYPPQNQSTPSCFSSFRASFRAHFTQLVSGLELRPRPSSSAGPISMPPYLQQGDRRPAQMQAQQNCKGVQSSGCKHGMCWLVAARQR